MSDHDFLPVNGHPDDDECTYRADGTDVTYCGESRAAHDTPTPAPALTDEQIERDISELRIQHGPAIDRFIAAVIARAKREAGEEIAQAIERESATLDHLPPTGDPGVVDYRMGLGHGMAGSAEHGLIGAAGIARQIGDHR